MTPRCSVLVPAFNAEAYVAQAVGSALSQTYGNLEVVVVNDGSTDRTAKVLEPLMDRIVYIEQENRGTAAARNAALRSSTGDFLALLDADDYWMPTRLERLVSFLKDHPEFGFVTSDAYVATSDRVLSQTVYGLLGKRRSFREESQAYWITQYNFVAMMAVIRRELFQRHGPFDETLRRSEDWDLWIRFILGGERVGFVAEPLGYYRFHEEAKTADWASGIEKKVEVLEKAFSNYGDQVPGLHGRLMLARARQRLFRGDSKGASSIYRATRLDRELPIVSRAESVFGSVAPSILLRAYRLIRNSATKRVLKGMD